MPDPSEHDLTELPFMGDQLLRAGIYLDVDALEAVLGPAHEYSPHFPVFPRRGEFAWRLHFLAGDMLIVRDTAGPGAEVYARQSAAVDALLTRFPTLANHVKWEPWGRLLLAPNSP